MAMFSNFRMYSSRFGRFKSKKSIDIVRVRKSQFPEAVNFMKKTFVEDPFVRAMGISVRHKETQNFLSKLWLTLLRSELSLAAIQRQKICGLCINCFQTQSQTKTNDTTTAFLELAQVAKTKSTRNLLHAWDKIDREVLFPPNKTVDKMKILELAACTVGYNHRRLGIAKKIIQSSADMAMLLGFDYARIDCTHVATARICNQLGWQKIWEMPFDKFDGVVMDTNFYDADGRENSKVQVYIKMLHSNLKSLKD